MNLRFKRDRFADINSVLLSLIETLINIDQGLFAKGIHSDH